MADQLRATARRLRIITVLICIGLVFVAFLWGWGVSRPRPSDAGWFTYAPNGGVIYSPTGPTIAGHDARLWAGATTAFLVFSVALVVPTWAMTHLLDGLAATLETRDA